MGNKWFDIDPPENDLDLSEFEEEIYSDYINQGFTEEEATRLAAIETEAEENRILECRRCCPDGICRGWC